MADATPPPPSAPVPQSAPQVAGEIGKPRPIGISILLYIVTLGIYGYFWNYFVFEEMKRYSGRGVGGVVGLLLWLFLPFVNFFLIPSEIKNVYEGEGRASPLTPLWGLWILLPIIGWIIWYVKVQGALNEFWQSKGAPAV